jgi:hypothetical protein
MPALRALVVLCAAAAAAGARADSISSLPDPLYAHATPPQPDPIFARIRSIVYPTMGLPTLLPYGGEFDVFVHTESAAADPAKWRVGLLLRPTGTAARFDLAVLAVARDHQRALTKLRVRVPARAPRDTYDL